MVTSLNIVSNTATRVEVIARAIREPVIAEPLNYSSGTNYGNCMWSVWKRKNVTLIAYGAMAKTRQGSESLRWHMEVLHLASENNWYKLIQMAVWVHSNSTHMFSQLPSHILGCALEEMARVRRGDYNRRCTTKPT